MRPASSGSDGSIATRTGTDVVPATSNDARLSGFTIRNGNADGLTPLLDAVVDGWVLEERDGGTWIELRKRTGTNGPG